MNLVRRELKPEHSSEKTPTQQYTPTTFGLRLRAVREALQLTRMQLGKQARLCASTIRNIERGYSPLGRYSTRRILAALDKVDRDRAKFVAAALGASVPIQLLMSVEPIGNSVERLEVVNPLGEKLEQTYAHLFRIPAGAVAELVNYAGSEGGRVATLCITIEIYDVVSGGDARAQTP